MADDASRCARCGAWLPSRAPDGLCPACLLEAAIGEPAVLEAGNANAPGARGMFGASARDLGEAWRRVGNYDLEEEIGRGGMGVVFRARQRGLNRIVAVKMVRGGAFADPGALARFRVEAELAARLRHPHIIQIHEIGEFEGQPYYSMDYVDGTGLDVLVREDPLPARRAAGYLRSIAEAVDHAHRQGVLHRDLKPSNILIDAADEPRVLDFGLARPVAEASGLTVGAQPLGSPSYAAPEQAMGWHERVGPATDVYSLGAILYHLLTCRPPFVAETLAATVRLVQETEPVGLRLLNPTVPIDLATICHACLEKEPGRRYPSARALAEDLTRFLDDEPIQARPVGWMGRLRRWCRRRPVVAGLSGALGLMSLAILVGSPLAAMRIERSRRVAEREAYAANIGLIKAHLDQGSTDVALALLRQCPVELRHWEWGYLMGLCHPEVAGFRALPSSNAVALAFAADGRRLLTLGSAGVLQVWEAFGDEREAFRFGSATNPVRCASFDDTGHRLAAGDAAGGVRVWEMSEIAAGGEQGGGGWASFSLRASYAAHTAAVNGVRWIDGGQRLLTAGDDGRIRIQDWAGEGAVFQLATPWRRARTVGLSPGGERIVARNDFGPGIGVWDRASGQPIPDRFADPGKSEVRWVDPAARYVVSADGEGNLTWRDAEGHTRELIRVRRAETGPPLEVFFAADGRWFGNSGDERTARVWRGRDGAEQMALPGRIHDGVFSADGRLLVTLGAYNYGLLWDLESGRERLRLTGHEGLLTAVAFSPDGRRVAGVDGRGVVRIWSTEMEAELPGERNSVWGASYAPRGDWVVVAPRFEGLSVREVGSGRWVARIRTPPEWVAATAFSPDGHRLVSVGSHRRVRVWEVGSWRLLASLKGHDRCILGAAYSRDGRWLFSYSHEGVVRLWDGPTLEARRVWDTGMTGPVAAALSADGRWVAVGDQRGAVSWWSAESGERVGTVPGHDQAVYGVVFSPDGGRLVTSSIDGTVNVWDRVTGGRVAAWRARGCDWPLVFSPDGRRLFAGTTRYDFASRDDPRLVVRDPQDGRELLSLASGGMVASLDYQSESRRLLTGTFEGFARQWTAFPWRPEAYPGPADEDLGPRIDRYGKSVRSRRGSGSAGVPDSGDSPEHRVEVGWEADQFPPRDPRSGPGQVDLTRVYTAPLDLPAFPTFGPFNSDCDLRAMPHGLVNWEGVWLDVRGVVQLGREETRGALFRRGWDRWPRAVRAIPVGCRGRRLHVVHGAVGAEDENRVIGRYLCTFADGSRHPFEVVYGDDVRGVGPAGLVDLAATRRGKPVWEGSTPVGRRLGSVTRVFLTSYENPYPEREIASLDFEATGTAAAPFLVALTVE